MSFVPTTDTRKRNALLITGFLLLIIGFVSLILDLVGVHFLLTSWLDMFGRGTGFFLKILIAFAGMTLAVASRSTDNDYDEFLDQ